MKKLLLLPFLFASIAQPLNAQYYPMLSDSNSWAVYVDVVPLRLQSPNSVQSPYQSGYVNTVKDTVVNSLTYKMFYSRSHDGNLPQWSLLREDTATQQVFIFSAGDNAERIIYDYSLNTGDSIWLDFMYPAVAVSGWWYVDSTFTVQIDAGSRKALYLTNPNNAQVNFQTCYIQWIESVGCNISPVYLDEHTDPSVGIMEQYMGPGCGHNTYVYSLTCAWQDSVRTYNSTCWQSVRNNFPGQFNYFNGDSCVFNLAGAVEDLGGAFNRSVLIPNPAVNSAALQFELNNSATFQVTITNVLGETVRLVSGKTWYAAGEHSVNLNLEGLAPGMYQVNMIGEAGRESLRLVVGY